jgi:tetratricopeptide (TPR) repeat protein
MVDMRLRRLASAVAFASVVAFASAPARAGEPAAAREQVKLGYTLAQEGKCEEAIPHFVESLRLDAKAITLINLASCEEKTARLAEALGHWVEARARAQAENNAAIVEEAEKRAKALEPRLPKLTVVLEGAPPDVEVVRDGVVLGKVSLGVPLPVNPGAHTLVVRGASLEETSETVSIAEGETKSVTLHAGVAKKSVAGSASSGRTDEGRGLSPLVYAGFGTAAVGLVVGSVTGVLALSKASTAKQGCANGECADQASLDAAQASRSMGTISTIGFAVGVVGAGVGIAGLVWGKPGASATVAVSLGPAGGALRGTF